jgi:transposase InsO family protein
VVLDLFARKVVGWAMAATMPQELTLAALRMAIANRRPGPGLLHHADRGSQLGLNRSSQHRGGGVVRWRVGGARIELYGES